MTIDHGAQANFVQILTGDTAVDDAVALALPASQPATVSFTYPGSIAAGVALRRGYWTIEADVQWMLWSSFDQVTITYANSPAYDSVLPEEWASTWRGALGVEYLIGDDWEVRGGFGYDHSPAPTADDLALHPRRRPLHVRGRRQLEVRAAPARLQRPVRGLPRELDARDQPLRLQRELRARAGCRPARRSATGSSRSRVAA